VGRGDGGQSHDNVEALRFHGIGCPAKLGRQTSFLKWEGSVDNRSELAEPQSAA
jgi:hypothetical protein